MDCPVCLEQYNALINLPNILACSHRVCSVCLKSGSGLVSCPLCREIIQGSSHTVDKQLLNSIGQQQRANKRMQRAQSPSSFPIHSGLLLLDDSSEDAPGTPPHPSAPALVEIQPCYDTDTDDQPSSRRLTGNSSLHRSTPSSSSSGASSTSSSLDLSLSRYSSSNGSGSSNGSRLGFTQQISTSGAGSGSGELLAAADEVPLVAHTTGGLLQRGSRLPVPPLTHTTTTNSSSSRARKSNAAAHRAGTSLTTAAAGAGAQQAVCVLSFPVPDLEPFDDNTNSSSFNPEEPSSGPQQQRQGSRSRSGGVYGNSSSSSKTLRSSLRSWPMRPEDLFGHSSELQEPISSTSSAAGDGGVEDGSVGGNVGRGSRRSRSSSRSVHANLAAVQAVASGAVCILQQLAVPRGAAAGGWLMGQQQQQGSFYGVQQQQQQQQQYYAHSQQGGFWSSSSSSPAALPSTSVVLAAVHSSVCVWTSYSTSLQRSLRACSTAQHRTQAAMESLLQRLGLPGYGQLACYWLATWVLGLLLYSWQLGLQLLPVAAASLALSAVVGMRPPLSEAAGSSSSRSRDAQAAAASGSSSRNSASLLPVWPSKAAGGLLAADCLALGLLQCVHQQTGGVLAAGPLLRLLAATPTVLAVVLLLLCGQVVVDALCRGSWWGQHSELRRASLLCRGWLVAAAGVLAAAAGGSSGSLTAVLATAAAWVQKAHMLVIEGPVFVFYLGSLLQQHDSGSNGNQPASVTAERTAATPQTAGASRSSAVQTPSVRGSRAAAVATATAAAGAATSSSNAGGVSAPLCCLQLLLQLLVLLFVPPGPLAAAVWLPQPLQSLLVWGARVLLCGTAMQAALSVFAGTSPTTSAAAAAAPAAAATLSSHPQQQQHQMLLAAAPAVTQGSPCCASPPPRGRPGWELQVYGSSTPPRSHNHNNSGSGSGCGSGFAAATGCSPMACRGSSSCSSPSPASCNSWALATTEPTSFAIGHCSALTSLDAFGGDSNGSGAATTAGAGVCGLLLQHAPYLVLLLAAFAGDTLITAATSATAAVPSVSMLAASGSEAAAAAAAAAVSARWAVRLAWQRCLQWLMVAGLCVEVGLAVRREVGLLLRMPLAAGSSSAGSLFWVPSWQQQQQQQRAHEAAPAVGAIAAGGAW